MLRIEYVKWYKVKDGQTLDEIAAAFCVAKRVLAQTNGLKEEVKKGQLLRIPETQGNAYTAGEGDTKALLCGSERSFMEKNGTTHLYPGMRVIL